MENNDLESKIKESFKLEVKRDYFFIKDGIKTLNVEDNENGGVFTLSLINDKYWNIKYALPKEGRIDFGNYDKNSVCILKTKLKGFSEKVGGETYNFVLNDEKGETSSYELRKEFCLPVLGEKKAIYDSYFFNEKSQPIILQLDNGSCMIKNKPISNDSGMTFYKTFAQLNYDNKSIEFDCEAAILDHKGNGVFHLNFMDEYGDKMIFKRKGKKAHDFLVKDAKNP